MENLSHYFIAIPMEETVQSMLDTWQKELKCQLSYRQWTHKQDLHITLKFLGPVEEERITDLQNELSAIKIPPFSVIISKLGTFGAPAKPRVLFAGVKKNNHITHLQKLVEDCAIKSGFKPEGRVYTPHITLAKKWGTNADIYSGELNQIKSMYDRIEQEIHINSVVLYQIYPKRVPKYQIIGRYPLKGGV